MCPGLHFLNRVGSGGLTMKVTFGPRPDEGERASQPVIWGKVGTENLQHLACPRSCKGAVWWDNEQGPGTRN